MPSGRRIYEEIWSMAQTILNKQSKFLKSTEHLWWMKDNWEEQLKTGRPLEPFVLKMVDRAGFTCCLCNWT